MKKNKKFSPDIYQAISTYLTSYAYLPEMKDDGSAFEKRKIKSAGFSADHSQLILTGSGKTDGAYIIPLKSLRKIYSRTDREFDKVIIRGFISQGEDFSIGERQQLTIYLKGHPSHHHIAVKIKNGLTELMKKAL